MQSFTLRCALAALFLALSLGALAGCGEEEAAEQEADPTTGTATLRFTVTNTVRRSPNLKDPLNGPIYGALWKAEEVTLTGPNEGAEELASVELSGVDLSADGAVTEPLWTSPALPPGEYIFLGFYDVDDNGADVREPESGDPVTLPTDKFMIQEGQTTDSTVDFDLVL
jgi:hypothetical protein